MTYWMTGESRKYWIYTVMKPFASKQPRHSGVSAGFLWQVEGVESTESCFKRTQLGLQRSLRVLTSPIKNT